MTYTVTQLPMTDKQHNFVLSLTAQRPNWISVLASQPALFNLVTDTLVNEQIRQEKSKNPASMKVEKFLDRKVASKAISALLDIAPTATVKTSPAPAAAPSATTQKPDSLQRLRQLVKAMPNGDNVKFALADEKGIFEFFSLDTATSKYGTKFRTVRQLIGAPGGWERLPMKIDAQLKLMQRLLARGWEDACKDYAEKFTRCARCDSPLSDARSQAAKIGEHCAGEWGWPW